MMENKHKEKYSKPLGWGECLMFSRTVINWEGRGKGRGDPGACSDHRDSVMPGDDPSRGSS